MKVQISKMMIAVLITLLSVSANADSGRYTCTNTCDTYPNSNSCRGTADPGEVAKALNSLKCDTTKPFSITSQGDLLTLVCCVQK